MNEITRFVYLLVFVLAVFASSVSAQSDTFSNDPDYAVYINDKTFEELSGAKRSILELKFGKKIQPEFSIESGFKILPEERVSVPLLLSVNNVLVNNPAADATVQDTQSETSVVLGSGSNVIIGFNDSGSFTSGCGANCHFTGFARSIDGGANFTDAGVLTDSTIGDAGDPCLARNNTTGRIYFSTLGFNAGNVLPVFRSDDDGQTWMAPVNAAVGLGSSSNDKEWIAVDNFPGTGNGNVYLFWRNFGSPSGMTFVRSTDHGATWGPSGGNLLLGGGGQGAFVTVGPDHTVYTFMYISGSPAQILLRKSTDQGVTFSAGTTVTQIVSSGVNGNLGLGGGFRTNAFPHAAVNPISGAIYVVHNDDGVGADQADIFFRKSTDGGLTWSAPIIVNNPTANDQWQPTIAVTPNGLNLVVTWYDRRLDPANTLIDFFAAIGSIDQVTGDVSFGNNFRVSSASFPVVIGQDPVINTVYMGDYDMVAADNNNFYIAWGDNRDPLNSHPNQPDVRAAVVPVSGLGPQVAAAGGALSAENCAPPNGVIDPDETVSVDLTLLNSGSGSTTNLVATLQPTGGVIAPSGPQNYGAIAASNSTTRTFSFIASGSCGGTLTATLSLQDGATNFGDVSFTFTMGALLSPIQFSNVSSIGINDNLPATPYSSDITVSGFTGVLGKITVTLSQVSHTFPDDVDILLVGPSGQKVLLMSDAGGGTDVVNQTYTFDDFASGMMVDNTALSSGTYKPSNYDVASDVFPAPAPVGPYGTLLSAYNGLDPNGTWSLFVRDDAGVDIGSIAGGWSISLFGYDCCVDLTNNPPVANDDSAATTENNAVTIDVLANDTDQDGDPLLVASITQGSNGSVVNNISTVTYTPNSGFVGTDTFTYNVVDGSGGSDIATATITVQPPCLFIDDFQDGVVDPVKWTIVKPSVTENGGDFVLTPATRKAFAVATGFSGCSGNCTIDTFMQTAGGVFNKVWTLAWFIDKKNTVEVLMKEENDKWILRQRVNKTVVRKAKGLGTISPNVAYHVVLIYDGTEVRLVVDGTQVTSIVPQGLLNGTVGYQAKNTTARFANVCVN